MMTLLHNNNNEAIHVGVITLHHILHVFVKNIQYYMISRIRFYCAGLFFFSSEAIVSIVPLCFVLWCVWCMVRGSSSSSSSSPPLPKGWKQVLDETTKRYYFWNIATNEVQWTRPGKPSAAEAKSKAAKSSVKSRTRTVSSQQRTPSASPLSATRKSRGVSGASSSLLKSQNNANGVTRSSRGASNAALPPNWEAVLDDGTRRYYYWNRKTGETSWFKPTAQGGAKAAAAATSASSSSSSPAKSKRSFGSKQQAAAAADAAAATTSQEAKPKKKTSASKLVGAVGTRLKRAASSMSSGWTKVKERKRRENVVAERFEAEEYEKKNYPKSDRARELLGGILQKHFLFQGLSRVERNEVVSAMCKKNCGSGEILIKQGDKGDFFYVVERGTFDVLVADKGKSGGELGKTVGQIEAGGSFGELALMYSCPRAATIRAKTKCTAWALDRATFRHMLQASSHKDMEETLVALRKVHILHNLTDAQLNKCAEAVRFVEFVRGERIINKGDAGDVFYIIRSGTVVCSGITSIDGQTSMELSEGDYFGERALLTDEPRAADVTAKGDVSVMVLNRHDFNEILGPLRDILDANIRVSVLKREQLFKCLNDEERQKIFDAFTMQTFKKGEYIIRQGDEGNCFYVMREERRR